VHRGFVYLYYFLGFPLVGIGLANLALLGMRRTALACSVLYAILPWAVKKIRCVRANCGVSPG